MKPLLALTAWLGLLLLSGQENAVENLSFHPTPHRPSAPARFPRPGEILITEIMADPTPPAGLPEAEYLELYNAAGEPLQLGGLKLATGSTPRELPPYVLEPDAYITVCKADMAPAFDIFGPAIGLSSFPALANAGGKVELLGITGELLDAVGYEDSWYQDPAAADGGYSLERADLSAGGDCPGLWAASRSPIGGTPGQANSLLGVILDSLPPRLLTAAFAGQELLVRWSEVIDTSALSAALFRLTPDLGFVGMSVDADRQALRLALGQPPALRQLYALEVRPDVLDCSGNAMEAPIIVEIGLPEPADTGDVVINELLFNPRPGSSDFVELYNTSEKIIDLSGWWLAGTATATGGDRHHLENHILLLPGRFLVLSPRPEDVAAAFPNVQAEAMRAQSLPAMPDDAGSVTLLDPHGRVVDAVAYLAGWHSPLLSTMDGVSLERLNPYGHSQSAGNWYSAASVAGFGTPTRKNSQYRSGTVNSGAGEFFSLSTPVFSPDGDGHEDVLVLEYASAAASGLLVRLRIFDARGRLVRRFDQLQLAGGSGQLRWEGTSDDGSLARPGIYLICGDLFSPEGDHFQQRLPVVLAVSFE